MILKAIKNMIFLYQKFILIMHFHYILNLNIIEMIIFTILK